MSEYIRRIGRGVAHGWVLVLLTSLFAIGPLLAPGLPNTADGPVHFYRAVDMDRCWRDGVYYPRWAPDLAFGYGTPLFNFAPPLIYYLIQALHLLGWDLAVAMKAIILLFLFLYGLGMYLFAGAVLGPRAGLLAAAAYLYAPYRLREAYIQGNYAQFLALAFYPFILWAFYKLVDTENPYYVIPGALACAALLLSHNISVMLFSPLLAAYVVFLLIYRRRWMALKWVLATLALTLTLAAFFWIPAFFERRWVQIEAITRGHFDFRLHFLSLGELLAPPVVLDAAALNPYLPLGLGLAQVALPSLALVALAWRSRFISRERAQVAFFALALGFSLFIMLPTSTFLWENVPLLALTEFPWRALGPATLAAAFLAGASLRLWGDGSSSRSAAALIISLAFVLVASFVYLYPRQPFVDYRGSTLADITAYELRTGTIGTTGASEFHPIWVEEPPLTSPMVDDYLVGRPITKLDEETLPDFVEAEALSHTAVADDYRLRSPEPFTARFNTFYFPGWRAYLDGEPAPIEISSPQGLIEVAVPAGEHRLSLRFEDTPVRRWANGLSIAALLVLLILIIGLRLRKRGSERRADVRGWSPGQALWVGGALLALLVIKEAFIDPYTSWFRKRSPPNVVLGVGHPTHVEMADGVLFLGHDIEGDVVRQGETLHLKLYWKATEPLEVDYRSFAHLDAPPYYTTYAASDNMHPGGIPISRWPPDLYTRDDHSIKIPEDAPPIEYTLQVGLYEGRTGRRLPVGGDDSIALQPIRVLRAEPLDPDRLPHGEERFTLGGRIELLGYEIHPSSVEAGGVFDLTLYWRAREEVEESYSVFVHALDAQGHLWSQGDSVPIDSMYPTSSWPVDQVVEDVHRVPVEGDAPAGGYRLAVGMYRLDTLERLEVRDPRGAILPEGRIILSTPLEVRSP